MSDPQLSRRERQIMEAIYARAEATAADVCAALPDAPTYTAVRTLLRILCEKGHLTYRRAGKKYVYRARRPRQRAGRSALRRVLQVYFGDSLEQALAAHLTDPSADLSSEELSRLSGLIEEARRKGK
jgi:BlaI family penicillinase repressor